MKRLFVMVLFAVSLVAQDLPDAPHKFMDKRNVAMFSGVSVVRLLDVHSTWKFRKYNRNEWFLTNGFVDNKPAFVAFTAGVTVGHVLGCYALHRAGWHRAERIASFIHIGAIGVQSARNYYVARPEKREQYVIIERPRFD